MNHKIFKKKEIYLILIITKYIISYLIIMLHKKIKLNKYLKSMIKNKQYNKNCKFKNKTKFYLYKIL